MSTKDLDPKEMFSKFLATADDVLHKATRVAGDLMKPTAADLQAVYVALTDDLLTVEAALPGYAKDSFALNVEGSTLTIVAKAKPTDSKFYAQKDFKHELTLPRGAKTDEISAKFSNGLLIVTVPVGEVPTVKVSVV